MGKAVGRFVCVRACVCERVCVSITIAQGRNSTGPGLKPVQYTLTLGGIDDYFDECCGSGEEMYDCDISREIVFQGRLQYV